MKKTLKALIITAAMLITAAGCSETNQSGKNQEQPTGNEEKKTVVLSIPDMPEIIYITPEPEIEIEETEDTEPETTDERPEQMQVFGQAVLERSEKSTNLVVQKLAEVSDPRIEFKELSEIFGNEGEKDELSPAGFEYYRWLVGYSEIEVETLILSDILLIRTIQCLDFEIFASRDVEFREDISELVSDADEDTTYEDIKSWCGDIDAMCFRYVSGMVDGLIWTDGNLVLTATFYSNGELKEIELTAGEQD